MAWTMSMATWSAITRIFLPLRSAALATGFTV